MECEEIVREFIDAWSNLDAEELASYFTQDAVYHNMPAEPVRGREAIRDFIEGFIAEWSQTDWEILNLLAEGNLVMVERIDHTRIGEDTVDLPLVGVFELEDGKIQEWRDYFDMETYVEAVG